MHPVVSYQYCFPNAQAAPKKMNKDHRNVLEMENVCEKYATPNPSFPPLKSKLCGQLPTLHGVQDSYARRQHEYHCKRQARWAHCWKLKICSCPKPAQVDL